MNKLSSKILEHIKKQNVTPRSRWYFALIHTLLGTAILTSIMVGGIAVAIVIRDLALTDWELAREFAGNNTRSFLMVIPYLWLIFIGLTILLTDSLYKHTKKGHRIKLWHLVVISIVLSIVFGGLFFFTKADQPIEESLSKNFKPYAEWKIRRDQVFVAPEKGVIAGKIVEIDENKKMRVVDFKEREWIIDGTEFRTREGKPYEVGERIGVIGEKTNHEHFKARRISSWKKDRRSSTSQKSGDRRFNERKY